MLYLHLVITSLLLVGTSLVARPAGATHPDILPQICPAPISVCQSGPLPADPTRPEPPPIPGPCPEGYRCACVPSCPECDDCAAEVCVLGERSECKTACDCRPGLGCFEGRCLAGIAAVFCCDSDVCPPGSQCQHRDGRMDRCDEICADELWRCGPDGAVGDVADDCRRFGRVCSCTASCQFCEDCGPGVCVPPNTPTPYACGDDGSCAAGDHCVCASSCPGCDDCVQKLCVPDSCDDPMCEERVERMSRKVRRIVRRTNRCETSAQCVHFDTTNGCFGTCGSWINRMYERPATRALKRFDDRICGTYVEDECPYATPGCLPQKGVCRRGRCRGVATDHY